ncbi:hypothetical protein VYU27_009517, partial [Nannochloropsis oceanica]
MMDLQLGSVRRSSRVLRGQRRHINTTGVLIVTTQRPMRYISTRGESSSSSSRLTFREAVLAGWAPDGGMLLPERIPQVTPAMLEEWRGLSYPQLVTRLLALFVTDDGD